MTISTDRVCSDGDMIAFDRLISAAASGQSLDCRVSDGLAVLEKVMIGQMSADSDSRCDLLETVEVEPDDLFDIVSIVMELDDPAARRVGLAGLVNALKAPDIDALQVSCLAIRRFCGWAGSASAAIH